MHNRLPPVFVALALGVTGCGGKNGPAEPAQLSAEQLDTAKAEQKRAEDEEKANYKADPTYKKAPVNSVDEEERRARRGR